MAVSLLLPMAYLVFLFLLSGRVKEAMGTINCWLLPVYMAARKYERKPSSRKAYTVLL